MQAAGFPGAWTSGSTSARKGGTIPLVTAAKVSRKDLSDLTRRIIPPHLFSAGRLGSLRGNSAAHLPRMDAKALKGGDE